MRKKLFSILIITIGVSSCKEDCDCFKYTLKAELSQKSSTICHFDAINNTYTTMSFNNDIKLQQHLDSHNVDDFDTVGECVALGIENFDLNNPKPHLEGDCSNDGEESTEVNGDKVIIICN